MFTIKRCESAASKTPGLDALAALAAQSYGPKGTPAGAMAARLRAADLPEAAKPAAQALLPLIKEGADGVKTALLLAAPVAGCGLAKGELEAGFEKAAACAEAYLAKAAYANGGLLPGGGLWLVGLARPFARLAEQGGPGAQALNALVLALKRPFIALAHTTGLDSYDAYAQLKFGMPNQFSGLRHSGLHGSAADETPYADIPTLGLNVEEERFRNLMDLGVTLSPAQAMDSLRLAGSICLAFAG